MLVIEQRALEAVCSLATVLERDVPKIADRLDRIARALENANTCRQSETKPPLCCDDDDLPI